jgi:hypothetical protein
VAGEARKSTVSAISSRLVQRLRSFGFIAAMLDAVSTSPGAIAFTRIPRSLPSSASVRVSASMPALAEDALAGWIETVILKRPLREAGARPNGDTGTHAKHADREFFFLMG